MLTGSTLIGRDPGRREQELGDNRGRRTPQPPDARRRDGTREQRDGKGRHQIPSARLRRTARYRRTATERGEVIEHEPSRGDVADAAAAILHETAFDERPQRDRHVGRQCAPVRLEANDGAQHLHRILAVERPPSGEHLVQHAPERPDVGRPCDRPCPFACSGDM